MVELEYAPCTRLPPFALYEAAIKPRGGTPRGIHDVASVSGRHCPCSDTRRGRVAVARVLLRHRRSSVPSCFSCSAYRATKLASGNVAHHVSCHRRLRRTRSNAERVERRGCVCGRSPAGLSRDSADHHWRTVSDWFVSRSHQGRTGGPAQHSMSRLSPLRHRPRSRRRAFHSAAG